MFKPLALYIGLRYTRTHRRQHFISFISLASMIGIALGVAVLITVLSVMNGFDEEIHKRFFGMAPEITIEHEGGLENWQQLKQQLVHNPEVIGMAPMAAGQGLATAYGQVLPIIITGILPKEEPQVSNLAQSMMSGQLSDLKAGSYNIILGKRIAETLGVLPGDKVNVMVPQVSVTLAGIIPRFKMFNVVGIFSAGSGFNFDKSLVFIHIEDAQKLLMLGNNVSGLRLKLRNIYAAPQLSTQIATQLPGGYNVSNWADQFGAFFKAIQLEKTMMFLILTLIIAVAAFNLVSSLVMIVVDKQPDIAILRTLGTTPRQVLFIFIFQGSIVGFFGTFIGVIGGILLALNATNIVDWLQQFLQIQLLSSNVNYVDHLPSKLLLSDVVKVSGVALLLSFLATLYPAWRAAATQPAEALRYE